MAQGDRVGRRLGDACRLCGWRGGLLRGPVGSGEVTRLRVEMSLDRDEG